LADDRRPRRRQAFSAEDPQSLRGPQFSCAWSDEMAKWRYAEAAFDMLQFGLRLGSQPRQLITTTPRPTALLKRLIEDPTSVVTRATTRDNANNLAPTFLRTVMGRYAGTQLGRQELEGEIIEDRPDALWSRALLESLRVSEAPPLQRIVWSRSIRRQARAGAPQPAASSPPALRMTASATCSPTTACPA
jgi:phage terminase large subunit-like protein